MASLGRLKTVMVLVAHGADVNATGKLSGPLHAAVESGHADIVDFILAQPTLDINRQTTRDRQTALHLASEKGNKRIVHMLLNEGARLDIKDWRGRTAESITKSVEV